MVERTMRFVGARPSAGIRFLPMAALVVDAAMAGIVGALAVLGREHLPLLEPATGIEGQLGVAGPLIVAGWIAVVALRGGYGREVFGSGTDEYKRIFNATLLTFGGVGVGCYFAKFDLARGFFVIAFTLGIPLLLLGRWCLRRALHTARRRGRLRVRVLLSGSADHVDEVVGVLHREQWLGYEVVGAVVPETEPAEETRTGVPVLGTADDVARVAVAVGADLLFFAGGSTMTGREMQQRLWELEGHDIDVVVAPKVADIATDRIRVRPAGGLPLIHIDRPRWTDAASIGKRAFDIAGSVLLLMVFSPLFLLAAARIWLHDRGPVLFHHDRVGRNGERFACLKFRTMVTDAERLVGDLQQEQGRSALLFKVKDDPRITKPGHWLRRFSVDELPQLLNVLRGDMSLVGPRPQVQAEVDLYEGGMARRLLVRPGMTGLWQVSGRNDLSADEAMRLDIYYVDNWSMVQDLTILWRTLSAVLSSRGAY